MVSSIALLAALIASAPTNSIGKAGAIVVYASRMENVADEIPSSVRIIRADEISRSGAQDIASVLERMANVHVRTMNSNPTQAQIAMRGFGENSFGRAKLIMDGEDLGSVDMQTPNLARIPLANVGRIEVLRGPNTVLYGDGAIAGVVNIMTEPENYERRTKLLGRGGSYGSAGLNFGTSGGFAEEGVRYSAAYDYLRSDGYRDRSGYDSHSVVSGVRKNFDNGASVGFRANYYNSLYQMPGALDYIGWKTDPRRAKYDNDWCRMWNYGFSTDMKIPIAEDQWMLVDGAFSSRHRKSNWGDYGYANEYDLYGFQISPRYINEKSLFSLDSKFTLGYEFRHDMYYVEDRSGYNAPEYDFNRSRHAVFSQEELFLTETVSLVGGVRGELIDNRWNRYLGLAESSTRDLMADFELGLVYRPFDGVKTYAKGARFHRSAFCDELNYTEDGCFLKPEAGNSLDLGVEGTFAKEFNFEFGGYWSVMQDEIFYNPHAKESAWGWGGYNCNSPGETDRLGFDTSLGWLREKVAEASIRYSFVKSKFNDGQYKGKEIPLVPQSRVCAEIGAWIIDDLEIKGGCNVVSSQVLAGDFDNAHDRLPSYVLFNLGAIYVPSWAEGWKATFTIDNLLDRNYCDFAGWSDYAGAYYYPACGRSFMISIGYEF